MNYELYGLFRLFEKKSPTRCMVTSVLMLEVNTMFL